MEISRTELTPCYSSDEIRDAQAQLNLQHPNSPWWDTPTGQDQCRMIKDLNLKRSVRS